jgi:alkaline phosphatase D
MRLIFTGFLFVLCVNFGALRMCEAATMTEVPVVGAMTSSSCKVRVRTSAAADIRVEYADNKDFTSSTTTSAVTTASVDDFTATVSLSGLNANGTYWYRILVDDVVQTTGLVHKFTTFPSGSATVTLAVFADVAPIDNSALAYRNAKNDGALFALQIGDLDHRNPTSLTEARTMHREMKDTSKLHGDDFATHILSKMSVVHVWDDHDYCGNDTDRTCAIRSDMWKAFDEHWPTYNRPNESAGLWHSFSVGDAEFFVLDLRSQRDQNSDTDDSDKSMLDGALIADDQKDWLFDGLENSTATWKIIVSSVTFNPTARPLATDAWKSFSTEREELEDHIDDNSITGVVVLSGDIHTGGAIDDGTNSGIGEPELSVPHTNLAQGNTSNLGTWSEGVTPGAKGYGLVTITSTSLKLEAYAGNGTRRHDLTLSAP